MRGDGVGAPRFGILGPLLVVGRSGAVRIGSHLQRLLLAVLLVDTNRTVSADRLVDELWSDHLPDDPGGALRTQVSRLRKALPGGTALVRDEGGYRLAADRSDLDAGRFEHLLEAAAGAHGADALRLVDGALQLWRGAPLDEFIDRPFALIEARRLQELHGAAREQRAALLLATGRPAEAAAEVEALLAEQPERERARALLMEALYLQGRHTEALDVYQLWRRQLAEEHGLEPSPALRRIEQRVLQHTMVESDTPPPGPVPALPVPRPVTSFIGRDTDVRHVADLLGHTRLVTLWGPGGVGKTRLSLEVGAQASGRYTGGVYVCDLTVLGPGGDVARAVATVVGVEERSGRRLEAQLVDRLGGRRALVILDNCEHVLAGAASLARRLIQSTSQVDVLATSRERLGVDAEHLWEVAPLATGGRNSPAVVLFLDRARATKASFEASPDGLDAIANVCRRLDGLPLAVELAAARVRGLAPEELLRALDRRFEVLTGGSGRPSRHRSLRAVIGWSYTQLQPVEQGVFDRLSVFRGPFDLDAATAVASNDDVDRAAVVPAVLRLLDCALLVEEPGSGRYSMLDTVRHYGLERLESERALDQARDRHARWALTEAERAARGLGTDAEPEWATTIEARLDELRAAHAWLVGHDVERALRLCSALRPYALWRGHSEIFRWAEVAAAAASGTRSALLPEVLLAASTGAWQRGDLESAAAAALAARDAARGLETATARAAIEASADVALVTGDLDRAAAEFTEASGLATAAGDLLQAVWDLGSAAVAVAYGGDTERALEIGGEVLSTAELSGSPSGKAFAHFVAGEILAGTQPERAEAHLRRALDLATAADGRFIAGLAEVALAASRVRQQDAATALTFCESAIRHWRGGGAWTPLWVTLRTVIALLMRVGAFGDAVVLYGATEAPGGPPLFGADASMMRDAAERLRSHFGDEEFHRRVDAGRAMTPDGATGFALEALSRASQRLSAV